MSSWTINIPPIFCLIRREYLYDLQDHVGETENVCVFGVTSIPPRALMFTCMSDCGAQFARLPISAFIWKEEALSLADPSKLSLDMLELWGAFSYDITVVEFDYLKDLRCACYLKDRNWYEGRYLMTFDWAKTAYAEIPTEQGFKTAHLVQLDNGCFALQPNNRMRWWEPSFVTKPFPERPDYKTNSHVWVCETKSQWATEDSDKYFYDMDGRA